MSSPHAQMQSPHAETQNPPIENFLATVLVSTISLSSWSFLWFSCILPATAYGSSSGNSTYAG